MNPIAVYHKVYWGTSPWLELQKYIRCSTARVYEGTKKRRSVTNQVSAKKYDETTWLAREIKRKHRNVINLAHQEILMKNKREKLDTILSFYIAMKAEQNTTYVLNYRTAEKNKWIMKLFRASQKLQKYFWKTAKHTAKQQSDRFYLSIED